MGEVFGGIFVVIWVIALISFITKAVSGTSKPQQKSGQPYNGTRPQVYDAQQESIERARQQAQSFRSVPGSTYGSSSTGSSPAKPRSLASYGQNSRPAANSGYSQRVPAASSYSANKNAAMFGQVKASRIGENNVLLEDRKNDWLAKQLREEAAILRRGSIYDLGASHEVSCDADKIKREHVKRHNTNGLNRGMFR